MNMKILILILGTLLALAIKQVYAQHSGSGVKLMERTKYNEVKPSSFVQAEEDHHLVNATGNATEEVDEQLMEELLKRFDKDREDDLDEDDATLLFQEESLADKFEDEDEEEDD
jgi:hypothetical protein